MGLGVILYIQCLRKVWAMSIINGQAQRYHIQLWSVTARWVMGILDGLTVLQRLGIVRARWVMGEWFDHTFSSGVEFEPGSICTFCNWSQWDMGLQPYFPSASGRIRGQTFPSTIGTGLSSESYIGVGIDHNFSRINSCVIKGREFSYVGSLKETAMLWVDQWAIKRG